MKNTNRFFGLAVIFFVFSCDKIKDPIVKKDIVVGSKFIVKSNQSVSNFRKVLLEDYTGQRCPNCPAGALTIKNSLDPVYTSSLVVISVHAGSLSQPFGEFINQDFRTAAGNTWNGTSGFNITSWPTGLVNRKDYAGNGILLSATKWTSVVPLGLADPFYVRLNVTTEYDTTIRALNVLVKAKFNRSYQNDVKIVALFIEDGVIGIQDNMGVKIEDYEFEHMMRGTINSTWGDDLKLKPIVANDSASVSFANFPLPIKINGDKGKAVNDKKVSVVVFAYDALTKEVLQVEKVKIR